MENLETALLSGVIIVPGSNYQEAIGKAYQANKAVQDFLEGDIDIDTFLDTVEFCEADMDEYAQVVDRNLDCLGF